MPTIIGALPVQLQVNTLADATQVMQDFNWIVNQTNANAAAANGGTFTNITITGASNILTGATFANGTFTTPSLTSPALTGTPTTPTQAFSDSSTQVVNSAWVRGMFAQTGNINLALSQASAGLTFNAAGF